MKKLRLDKYLPEQFQFSLIVVELEKIKESVENSANLAIAKRSWHELRAATDCMDLSAPHIAASHRKLISNIASFPTFDVDGCAALEDTVMNAFFLLKDFKKTICPTIDIEIFNESLPTFYERCEASRQKFCATIKVMSFQQIDDIMMRSGFFSFEVGIIAVVAMTLKVERLELFSE